jgi:hypothetical protein
MKKLIICFDGLGYDRISKEETPFLHSLKVKNKLVELKTIFGFLGIPFSFFSGQMPAEHDIWSEFVKKDKSLLGYVKPFTFLGRKAADFIFVAVQLLAGKTHLSKTCNIPFKFFNRFDAWSGNILELPFFKNKKYIYYQWPLFIKNGHCYLILKREDDESRIKRLFGGLSDKIDIYYTHVTGLDKTIHRYGRDHQKTLLKLKEIDELAKKYYGQFLERFPEGEIYYWSDHSFCDIEKYIDIQSMMPKSRDYLAFYGGTHISFWFGNENIKNKIIRILSSIKEGYILAEEDRINQHIPLDKKHGELIFAIKPGNLIYPNYYQKSKDNFVSMHGYDTRFFNKNGFLASSKKVNGKKMELSQAINIINGK